MVTDSAVGAQEENNLRHLVANLGDAVAALARRSVPDDEAFAGVLPRLRRSGRAARFPSLVVLGGDKHVGRPRCVEHAWQLREQIRAAASRVSSWAGGPIPRRDPRAQIDFLLDAERQRGLLSHADRLAPSGRHRSARSWTRRRGAAWRSRRLRRVLLSQRQPDDAADAETVSAGAGRGARRRVRGRRDAGRRLRADDSRRCSISARGTFTSATCRCAARHKR